MMRKTKLAGYFTRLNVVQLLDKAKHIAFCLQPQPTKEAKATSTNIQVPFYDDLITAIENLEDCNERCKTIKTAIVERDIMRKQLTDVLNKIKSYLETYHGDDPALLATTGYDLSKTPEPIPVPTKPAEFTVKATNEGSVDLQVKPFKGIKSYEFCYKLNKDTQWVSATQASAKCSLRGLTSGEKYDFKVAYITKTPNKIYSSILSTFIL